MTTPITDADRAEAVRRMVARIPVRISPGVGRTIVRNAIRRAADEGQDRPPAGLSRRLTEGAADSALFP